ncbi:unnamed protein product [Pleuronectes platessa]|uniref:Uncharacterized protein n=1 Tax=Pleuronectes platessa TaxID=8262 RepID=A0A9N7VTR2_PLEPL|nr:unnamed protein product [Pleuronectes platessa]
MEKDREESCYRMGGVEQVERGWKWPVRVTVTQGESQHGGHKAAVSRPTRDPISRPPISASERGEGNGACVHLPKQSSIGQEQANENNGSNGLRFHPTRAA